MAIRIEAANRLKAVKQFTGKDVKEAIQKFLGNSDQDTQKQAQRYFKDTSIFEAKDVANFFEGLDAEGHTEDVLSILG